VKIGLLSDAHGDRGAFETGVRAVEGRGVDRIYFLGDSVGYTPGAAVVDAIDELCIPAIAGNHEAMVLATKPGAPDDRYHLAQTRADLGEERLARIAAWPQARIIGGRALLVHGSPRDFTYEYVYPDSSLAPFVPCPWSVVCMGHTHRPFVRRAGHTTFVNVGSCALPRDADRRGAAAIVDTDTAAAEIIRFDIDRSAPVAVSTGGFEQ
jgi:predicted phosphodiesterase